MCQLSCGRHFPAQYCTGITNCPGSPADPATAPAVSAVRRGIRIETRKVETLETIPDEEERQEPHFAMQAPESVPDDQYRMIVRDLVLPWRIGVRQHEENRRQRVRINLDLIVDEQADPEADDYPDVICYEKIVERIREMASEGHVKLAETVAHKVAVMCLEDPRVHRVTVRVEKLEAMHDAASAGVEVTRSRRKSGKSAGNGSI